MSKVDLKERSRCIWVTVHLFPGRMDLPVGFPEFAD